MSLDLTALRRMVWKPIGMDTDNDPELPRDEIDLYLNRSFWEVMDKFDFREKERMATFNTIAGTARYNMPEPFESIQGLYVVDEFGKSVELQQVTDDIYEEFLHEDAEHQGFPTYYRRVFCYAELWPIPDEVVAMRIKRLITLADLSVSNATPVIPQVWHEVIGYGALWRAWLDIGDMTRMNATKHLQNALINTIEPVQVKEKKANTAYAGLHPIRPRY